MSEPTDADYAVADAAADACNCYDGAASLCVEKLAEAGRLVTPEMQQALDAIWAYECDGEMESEDVLRLARPYLTWRHAHADG